MKTITLLPAMRCVALTVLAGWCASGQAIAQDTDSGREKPPLWEIGLVGGALSQQAYPGSNQQVSRALLAPYVIYRGEFFRVDRGSMGLRAVKTDNFELDLSLAGSLGSGSTTIKAREGMPTLGTMVELGPRAKWQLGETPGWGKWRLELPVRGVFDMSDGAAFRGLSWEPKLAFDGQAINGWRYGLSASLVMGDCKLATTLYEVKPAQSTSTRPVYDAKEGLIATRLAANVSKPLDRDWTLFGYARVDSVAGAANKSSPLVLRTTGTTVGLGVVYTWKRSTEKVKE